jgi:hypothetical protein
VEQALGGTAPATDALVREWGRTTLVRTVAFPDNSARDAALRSGLERDTAASFDRLAQALA